MKDHCREKNVGTCLDKKLFSSKKIFSSEIYAREILGEKVEIFVHDSNKKGGSVFNGPAASKPISAKMHVVFLVFSL